MHIFSPIPKDTVTSDGENRLKLTDQAELQFGRSADSANALVGPAEPIEEWRRQPFARITLNHQNSWARVTFSLQDVEALFVGDGLEQELELSFCAFCDAGDTGRFDFVSLLQSAKEFLHFRPAATFKKDVEIGPFEARPTVLKARLHRSKMERDGVFALVFQVAQGTPTFYLSHVVLAPAIPPDQLDPEISGRSIVLSPETENELAVRVTGVVQTEAREVNVEADEKYRALTLRLKPNACCAVSFPLDDIASIPVGRPVAVNAVLEPRSSGGRALARIERGGLFGFNLAGLDHRWGAITGSTLARRFSACIPRDDGLSGRRAVFYFEAGDTPADYALTILLRESAADRPFWASDRPMLVLEEALDEGVEVPALFDREAALRSILAVTPLEARQEVEAFTAPSLWSLFRSAAPGEIDPHPLFSVQWHYRLLEMAEMPTPSDPGAAFEAYLSGEAAIDPHPLIDESYLREQLGAERGDRSGLECFLASETCDLRPNRLFDTRRVAAEMAKTGASAEGLSASEVLIRYLEDPRFWGISTSSLFDPEVLSDGEAAPLVRYLSEPSLWMVNPTPLFDALHFSGQPAIPRRRRIAPLAEYLALERQIFPNPGPLFNTRYYAMQADRTWAGGASPLETFVTTLEGSPHPCFDRASYLAQAPVDKIFRLTMDDFVAAGVRFDGPRYALRDGPNRTIVQMTGRSPRNPYYRQMPEAFILAKLDFRHSVKPDEMAEYADRKKDLILWWHQLEPFYHDAASATATKDRAEQLVANLSRIKKSGAKLIHTWHNALPYGGRYRDIDYKLLLDVAPLFDLILVHAERGVPWIRKFAPSANVVVVPHPSLVRHFNTTIDRDVARDILKIPRDVFLVHSFGEMKAYKRIDLLVAAWSKLKQTEPDPRLVLALTGHWKEKAETFEAAHRLPDCMIVDEIMPDARLALWIAAADVCAFSHPQVWASGAVMTALSFGKPMIVPDETGLTEVVQDDQNGFVFENGNPASIADAIRRARDFAYPEHAAFLNRAKAAELHPFRLQPQISKLVEAL